jgi:hypothetical protein
MSFAFWFLGRQLREALKLGQPEEARRLLQPYLQARRRQALEWLPDLVRGYVKRAQVALSNDDAEAAWKDVLAAETLQAAVPELAAMRGTLTKLGAAECRAALLAGKPLPVIDKLGRLQARAANHPEFPLYESVARDWVQATEMAHRGDFAAALGHVDRMKQSLPEEFKQGLEPFEKQLRERYDTFRNASADLYKAAEQSRWADVLQQADAVMAVAPEHREVRSLKERAWAVLQANSKLHAALPDQFAITKAYEGPAEPEEETTATPTVVLPKRFLLWIDGVGGYLVCLGNRVGFGQATVSAPVDVPLFADVSRLQAEMQRDAEGYVLESGRGLMVNGNETKRCVLANGDRVTLGSTCQFVFTQPVPISPTARLELVSGHRLPVAVDGVILMAENLILGPIPPVHVLIPDATANIVIYRSKDGLSLRTVGAFTIDRRKHEDRATLQLPAHVASDSFSFALEPVGQKL